MADDSIDILEPLDFHPCDTPRGCLYYDMDVLTDCQQKLLNKLKLRTIHSNEKYLRLHPEIRAFVSLITRWVHRKRPHRDVVASINEFFNRPRKLIDSEVDAYIANRPQLQVLEKSPDEDEDLLRYFDYITNESMQEVGEEENATQGTSEEIIKMFLDEHVQKITLNDYETLHSDRS